MEYIVYLQITWFRPYHNHRPVSPCTESKKTRSTSRTRPESRFHPVYKINIQSFTSKTPQRRPTTGTTTMTQTVSPCTRAPPSPLMCSTPHATIIMTQKRGWCPTAIPSLQQRGQIARTIACDQSQQKAPFKRLVFAKTGVVLLSFDL